MSLFLEIFRKNTKNSRETRAIPCDEWSYKCSSNNNCYDLGNTSVWGSDMVTDTKDQNQCLLYVSSDKKKYAYSSGSILKLQHSYC